MSRHQLVEGATTAVLAIAIAANGFLVLRAKSVSTEHRDIGPEAVYRTAEKVSTPPVDAYDPAGNKLAGVASTKGWAIRYASASCGYCAQDSNWDGLARELVRAGYPVTVVLTKAAEQIQQDQVIPAAAPQAAYVSMEWISKLRVTMTPTLVIFDGRGGVVWHRQGVLEPEDVRSALRALARE